MLMQNLNLIQKLQALRKRFMYTLFSFFLHVMLPEPLNVLMKMNFRNHHAIMHGLINY